MGTGLKYINDDPVSLVHASPLSYYPAKIPYKHWQLRSLLCSPAPGILYYPTGKNIYSLNTETRKRELVATLPFSPRCLGAKYGWVCAGGVNDGQFASIKVGDHGKLRSSKGTFDNESAAPTAGLEFVGERLPKPEVRVSELGGLIVNSVTLHRRPESRSDDDVLAILTNNDKTVRIFSLSQNKVQATLYLDIATNHASISPNGKHLVVVGDSTQVYFYHSDSAVTPCEAGLEPWTRSSQHPLKAGTDDALISTSFSPSSMLCAVASQEGSITVFDTRYLSKLNSDVGVGPFDNNPGIVKTIPSSRVGTYAGAVRSVQFSPAPWDLLIWAEHSGRVGVADVRTNFNKRQVIDVVVESKGTFDIEAPGSSEDEASLGRHEDEGHRSNRDEKEGDKDTATDEMEGYPGNQLSYQEEWSSNAGANSSNPSAPYFSSPQLGVDFAPPSFPNTQNRPGPLPQAPTSPTARTSVPPSSSGNHALLYYMRQLELLEQQRAARVRNESSREIPNTIAERVIPPPAPRPPNESFTRTQNGPPATTDSVSPNRPAHWRFDYEAQIPVPPSTSGNDPVSPFIAYRRRLEFLERQQAARLRRELSSRREVLNAIAERVNSPPAPRPPNVSLSRPQNGSPPSTDDASPTRPTHWRVDYEAQRRPTEELDQILSTQQQLNIMIVYESRERRRNSNIATAHDRELRRSAALGRFMPQGGGRGGITSAVLDRLTADLDGREMVLSGLSVGPGDCDGVDITGCTLSVDGSKLYVATDKGIVEYKMDLTERRTFPSVMPR